MTVDQLRSAVSEEAKSLQTTQLTMLSLLSYFAIGIGQTRDAQFYTGQGLALPLIQSVVSLETYYIAGAGLIVLVHLFFLLHTAAFCKKRDSLLAECGTQLSAKEISELESIPFGIFSAILPEIYSKPIRFVLRIFAVLCAAIMPMGILLIAQVRCLCFHSALLTDSQRLIVIADVLILLIFFPGIFTRCLDFINEKLLVAVSTTALLLIAGYACLDANIPDAKVAALPQPWNLTDKLFRRYLALRGQVLKVSQEGATTNETSFMNFRNRDLRFADLMNTTIIGASLEGVDFGHANLVLARFIKPDFGIRERADGKRERKINFAFAEALAAKMDGMQLAGSDLRGADFAGASLEGADLENADLTGAMLDGANLKGANLRGAICRVATFIKADLRYVNLSMADCTGTEFRNAVFFKTFTSFTKFDLADLAGICEIGLGESGYRAFTNRLFTANPDEGTREITIGRVSTLHKCKQNERLLFEVPPQNAILANHDFLAFGTGHWPPSLNDQQYTEVLADYMSHFLTNPIFGDMRSNRLTTWQLWEVQALSAPRQRTEGSAVPTKEELRDLMFNVGLNWTLSEGKLANLSNVWRGRYDLLEKKLAHGIETNRTSIDSAIFEFVTKRNLLLPNTNTEPIDILVQQMRRGDPLAVAIVPRLGVFVSKKITSSDSINALANAITNDARTIMAYASLSGLDDSSRIKLLSAVADTSATAALRLSILKGRHPGTNLLLKAADEGDCDAAYVYGATAALSEGASVLQNEMTNKAGGYLLDAASRGNIEAERIVGDQLLSLGDEVGGRAWLEHATEGGDITAENNLAFLLATSPNKDIRSPEKGVQLAESAVRSTPTNDLGNLSIRLDTLAAAYAAEGFTDLAAKVQGAAVDAAIRGKDTNVFEFKERLKLYEAGKRSYGCPAAIDANVFRSTQPGTK